MKATAVSPSNIAFIKYWGKKDTQLRLPANGSISMNLSGLTTTTTVEFNASLKTDECTIDDVKIEKEQKRVSEHLDRIRSLAHISTYAKVVSRNNFPSSTGLSSSASGFAALTVAAVNATGLSLPEKELSILARQGSGSACRSIPDGFVKWTDGNTNESSYAFSIAPSSYWNIVDIVAITNSGKKDIPTSEGMKLAETSPFYQTRLTGMDKKLESCALAIKNRDFTTFGTLIELEALNMHAVMMTSNPPLLYLSPHTLSIIREIQHIRGKGIEAYVTMNTGQDVHILCLPEHSNEISKIIQSLPCCTETIMNHPSCGAHCISNHLF